MDDCVRLTRSCVNEIRGFLNVFSAKCKDCMRRNTISCDGCMCGRAIRIMSMMDTKRETYRKSVFQQSPYIQSLVDIMTAIRDAGRPVMACELKLTGMSKQKIHWNLKKMCKDGYVVRVETDIGPFYKIGYRKLKIPGIM